MKNSNRNYNCRKYQQLKKNAQIKEIKMEMRTILNDAAGDAEHKIDLYRPKSLEIKKKFGTEFMAPSPCILYVIEQLATKLRK